MRKPFYYKNSIHENPAFEGECIEQKIERLAQSNEPIITDGTAPIMYTVRKDGVRQEFNIRADKWDIAQEAMAKVSNKYKEQRRQNIEKYNASDEAITKKAE